MLINPMHPRNTSMSSLHRTLRARGDAQYTNYLLNLLPLELNCTVDSTERHYLGSGLLLFTGGSVSGLQPLSGFISSQNLTSLDTITISKCSRNMSVTSLLRSLRLLGTVNPTLTLVKCKVASTEHNHQPWLLLSIEHRQAASDFGLTHFPLKQASMLKTEWN